MANNPSEIFLNSFLFGGTISTTCSCGRKHVSTNSPDIGPEVRQSFLKQLDQNPFSQVKTYDHDGGVTLVQIGERTYVIGCPCNGPGCFEQLIWEERAKIIKYIKQRTQKEQEALAVALSDL